MIRILHSVSYMHRAGVETFLMNYYRHIDRSVIQFDFLCNKQIAGDYDEEIRSLGGRIFYRPDKGTLQECDYDSFYYAFICEHPEIQIIHAHNGAKQFYPLEGAKRAKLPIRIAHAHSSDFVHDENYSRRLALIEKIPSAANYYFGCSNRAGEFFFGEELWGDKGVLIHNAIPCRLFAFNTDIRNRLRSSLHIEKCFVIGHVGRFMPQKNHIRLLEIFRETCNKSPNARLLLIGSGALEASIKEHASSLGIIDHILFCGEQADMFNWYQAMDVYVMPSLFEGLTLSGIEAQAAGLPCVFSDAVSAETKVTDDVSFVPLDAANAVWSSEILRYKTHRRKNTFSLIRRAGYDICEEARKLQNIYCQLVGAEDQT